MALLTAIIVTYDSGDVLAACLKALNRDGIPGLVVDNASTDDTLAIAQAHGASCLPLPRNEGYGRGNNAGVAAASTEFVLIINPDVVLEEGAVAGLVAALERCPEAGMVAPRIIEPDGRFFFSGRSLLRESLLPVSSPRLSLPGVTRQSSRKADAGNQNAPLKPHGFVQDTPWKRLRRASYWIAGSRPAMTFKRMEKHPLPTGDCCTSFLSGACLLMRRQTFLDMGGFDPGIFLFYEDDDLCRRLSDRGLALIHVHDAVARHVRGGSSRPAKGRVFRVRWHQAWSRAYVSRKYGLPNPAWLMLAINALKWVGACLMLNRRRMERYGGSAAGALAFLMGKTARRQEGL